jgi:AcrR family transcriptional regulator
MSSQKRRYELKARADRQRQTRERIIEATVALHEEAGPANTTVSEIARRAGVQRLTVYNHFPQETELFAACQGRFLAEHPPPDLGPALALQDPRARVQAALGALYSSYRDREAMTTNVLRDRKLLPGLDQVLSETMDAQLRELGGTLAAAFRVRGTAARRLEATIALALDFATWRQLKDRGFSDQAAAGLMADLVVCAGHPPRTNPPGGGSSTRPLPGRSSARRIRP